MSAKCLKCEKHVLDCKCLLGSRPSPKARDHCAGCEHPEVIRMLIPRLEELEKKIDRMQDTSNNDFDRLNLAINTIIDQERRIAELEKRIEEIENNYGN